MKIIKFDIPGEPKGKGRPKFNGKFAYTPQDTVNYENLVKIQYQSMVGQEYTESEIEAVIKCFYGMPKSMSKSKRAAALNGELLPTKKPDLDNIAKIILDSLNGIAYKDDSQVTWLTISKHYAEIPRVEVELRWSDV